MAVIEGVMINARYSLINDGNFIFTVDSLGDGSTNINAI